MFFRRKNKKKQKPEELRQHYRRAPGKKHALSIKLERQDGATLSGELADLSAGGVGILFPLEQDPEFAVGETMTLHFSALVHDGTVKVDAEMVRCIQSDATGVRYGFRFTSAEDLFEQLDSFYLKFFNRRRDVRLRPALDRRFTTQLHTSAGTIDVTVHDISPSGFGFVMPETDAFAAGDSFEVELFIPKQPEPVRWPAKIAHITGGRVGMEFDVERIESSPAEHELLKNYCAQREIDMARWDNAG